MLEQQYHFQTTAINDKTILRVRVKSPIYHGDIQSEGGLFELQVWQFGEPFRSCKSALTGMAGVRLIQVLWVG